MAPGKVRNKRSVGLEEKLAKDYDPEADVSQARGDGSESEDSGDDLAGTEHYVAVEGSKLRRKDGVSLGPQYRGARVSRAALEDASSGGDSEDEESEGSTSESEFDDPDEVDLEADEDEEDGDAEIDSENALGESDLERYKDFKFRGSSKPQLAKEGRVKRRKAAEFFTDSEDGLSEGQSPAEEEMASESSDEDVDVTRQNGTPLSREGEDDNPASQDSEDDDEQSEGDPSESEGESAQDDDVDVERAELRKIMKEGQKGIISTISQAAKADAEKGFAVRQQRRTFDSLLNLRIRLQKALVAANSFSVAEATTDGEDADKEPYEAAEEAAVKLWNSIVGFRQSLVPESARARIGQKRKRDAEMEPTDQSIWEAMEGVEEAANGHRRKVLDKWSARVRGTAATSTTRKLGPTTSQSLVSVLDDQLLSMDRLVKRTRIPRSCAPVQAAQKVAEDPDIYDDADFYQLLLKELVDQRTLDSSTGGGSGGTAVRWAALKEAKTRKQVDRKASKGRKLRYTVHEKLQNFMAPEDRRSWEQDAIDRFFGTLFGQKMALGEEDDGVDEQDDPDSDQEMGGASIHGDGLRLFGS